MTDKEKKELRRRCVDMAIDAAPHAEFEASTHGDPVAVANISARARKFYYMMMWSERKE